VTLTGHLTSQGQRDTVPRTDLPQTFFTLSNLLSISRALLVIPFAIVMFSDTPASRYWGALIMVVAALTDKVDGLLARKLHQTSEWGKILDPLADKVAVASAAVVLLALNAIPLWFVCLVLVRDLLILSGGLFIKSRLRVLLPSNELGKWTVGIVALTLFLLVLGIQSLLTDLLLFAAALMVMASFALYLKRFAEIIRG